MATAAPKEPQREHEERVVEDLLGAIEVELRGLVNRGVLLSVLGRPEVVAHDIVQRLGVAKNPWAEIVGPCYTSGALQRELGVGRGAVSKAVGERRALRLVTEDEVTLYPAFQVRNGNLVRGLRDVLAVLSDGVDDPWTWAQWLNTPLTDATGQPLPRNIERLAAGDLAGVLNDARHDAAAWAA